MGWSQSRLLFYYFVIRIIVTEVSHLEIILYLSAAVAAIGFFILVIYLSMTLKTLQTTIDRMSKTVEGTLNSVEGTLNSVSKTLEDLERQLDGVTSETAKLLQKTNNLADDIHDKTARLNTVVDAVEGIGLTLKKFNQSLQKISTTVEEQVEQNQEKISQVIQWGNIFIDLKDKWKRKKRLKQS